MESGSHVTRANSFLGLMTIGKSHFHLRIKIKSYYSLIIIYETSI